MKISFCITCKNRFNQVFQTLSRNLKDNADNMGNVEFLLVDFDSNDNLKEWVLNDFQEELASGYLKFFFTKELPNWNCSLAKNTAHLYATGDILVNLDCDNFTGLNGAKFISDQFSRYGNKIVLHQFSGNFNDGSYGRISVHKLFFHTVGGYNEEFLPMGHQDADLIQRLCKIGLFYTSKSFKSYNRCILNTKEDSIRFTNSSKTYMEMLNENRELSMRNINFKKLRANNGLFGIRNNMYQWVNGEMKQL
nr:glycosyltransferase [uncultured Pedobacter sp.]